MVPHKAWLLREGERGGQGPALCCALQCNGHRAFLALRAPSHIPLSLCPSELWNNTLIGRKGISASLFSGMEKSCKGTWLEDGECDGLEMMAMPAFSIGKRLRF